jgi:hypothetical protein
MHVYIYVLSESIVTTDVIGSNRNDNLEIINKYIHIYMYIHIYIYIYIYICIV